MACYGWLLFIIVILCFLWWYYGWLWIYYR